MLNLRFSIIENVLPSKRGDEQELIDESLSLLLQNK